MSGAASLWATAEWRRRWATLLLAWLVLAITGSLALGAAMTARRSVTAFERLRESTAAAEVTIFNIDPETAGAADATAEDLFVRLLPLIGATGASIEKTFFVRPTGSEWIPFFDIYPVVQQQLLDTPINVPIPIAGRLPASDAPNEIALSERLAELLGVSVGDSIAFESASIAWIEKTFSGQDAGPLDGPDLDFVVTGIAVAPIDFGAPVGTVYLTTAFSEKYAEQVATFPSGQIRTNDPALAAEMIRTGSPGSGSDELDAATELGASRWGDLEQVNDGLRVGASALWIFAVAAAVAGLSIVALIIRRLARTTSTELQVLSALGLSRLGRAAYGTLLLVPVIAFAALGTLIGARALTPHIQPSLAAQVEPNRGDYVDWPLAAIGTMLLALLAVAGTAVAFAAIEKRRDTPERSNQRPALSRQVPISVGVRQALGARSAIVTATLLVATVAASIVVGASLSRLPFEPQLWGGGADATIDFGEREGGESNDEYMQALDAFGADDRIGALTGATLFYPEIDGSSVTTLALDTRRGEPILTILAGRSPRTPDEVAMGRETMNRLNVDIGDDVAMTLAGETESFRIVGQAAFAVGDFKMDDGSAITRDGGARFVEFDADNRLFQILIEWRDGVDAEQLAESLIDDGFSLFGTRQPPVVANLLQVERLPSLLALFFGALGMAFLGYALAASSRARGRQLAVLGALGLRRAQLAALLRWHAAAMALVAVLIGVPAGLIAGRVIWTAIADSAGVGVEHAVPISALLATVALAVLGSVAIAIAIGSRLRRADTPRLLRAD